MPETTPMSSIETSYTPPPREVSMLSVAAALLRRSRVIIVAVFLGGLVGGLVGLNSVRTYTSSATFLAHSSDQGGGLGLAAAASQFGLRVAAPNGGWSPALYAKIARSRSVLGPIAADSFTVPELGNRRIATLDLLKIKPGSEETRIALGVDRLSRMVETAEDKTLGTVLVTVKTPWPSFSLALAQRVLAQINAFNVQTRRSQATAEREFADQQVTQSESTLRDAENRMEAFLQANRDIRAPHLVLESDRLQREVVQAQTLYTGLLQAREDARLREVRDTPVISVLEEPRYPIKANSRGTLVKAIAGGFLAGLLAILAVLLVESFATLRRTESPEAVEFFTLLGDLTPWRSRASKV